MTEPHPWSESDDGFWCTCCGNMVARPLAEDETEDTLPEECRQCGFPDPDRVADYHGFGDDDDFDPDDDDDFDCQMGPDGYCGAAGSEWCDWECPHGGLA